MTPLAVEFNFDGIVGPTHNYAGLAHGNLASQQNRHLVSHPREAALQGLAKMKFLADLDIPQAVLPPQLRPHFGALRRLGFTGSELQIVERAASEAPHLLAACYSASAMWAANAATVCPSADSTDGRMHITPANLASHLHRSLEADATADVLRQIFPGDHFIHHDPLPANLQTTDEGAANHTRLSSPSGGSGLHLFVYGTDAPTAAQQPSSARQTLTASQAVARLHTLPPQRTLFLQQNPAAIAAGVFHNDVIAVGHGHHFVHHERAFAEGPEAMQKLSEAFRRVTGTELNVITIPDNILPLADAVRSYFFNSQLVSLPNNGLAFIAPTECEELPTARAAINLLRDRIPDIAIHFINVRESMRNGGGPACLRLRVVLTPEEQASMHRGVRFTNALHEKLKRWVEKHYRENIAPADLADPALVRESKDALDALQAMGIPVSPKTDP